MDRDDDGDHGETLTRLARWLAGQRMVPAKRSQLRARVPVGRAVPGLDGDRACVGDVPMGGEEARVACLERDYLAAVRLQDREVVRVDDPVPDDPVLEDAVRQL